MALNPSSGWSYYKQIDVTDSNNVSANYQMKLKVYSGTGSDNTATGEIYCNNHCSNFPNDIRFGTTNDPSTATQLAQWIEESDATSATIWVKMPSDGSNTFYMFVGNSTASQYSSGDDTWIYFEDFTGTDGSDPSGWTDAYSYWQIASNTYKTSDADYNMRQAYITDSSITNMRIKAKLKISSEGIESTGDYIALMFRRQSTDACYWFAIRYNVSYSNRRHVEAYYWDGSANTSLFNDSSYGYIYQDTWHDVEVRVYSNTANMFVDGTQRGGDISLGSYITTAGNVGLTTWKRSIRYADDFCVGKYYTTEPTWSSFGSWIEIGGGGEETTERALDSDQSYGSEAYLNSEAYGNEIYIPTINA